MSDIVTRLRERTEHMRHPRAATIDRHVMRDAINEIERLRAENEWLHAESKELILEYADGFAENLQLRELVRLVSDDTPLVLHDEWGWEWQVGDRDVTPEQADVIRSSIEEADR